MHARTFRHGDPWGLLLGTALAFGIPMGVGAGTVMAHERMEQRALALGRGDDSALELTVRYQLAPGPQARRLWAMIDLNRNGRVDGEWELLYRARVLLPLLLRGLGVQAGEVAPALRLVAFEVIEPPAGDVSPGFRVTARFQIELGEKAAERSLTFVRAQGNKGQVAIQIPAGPSRNRVELLDPGARVTVPVPAAAR